MFNPREENAKNMARRRFRAREVPIARMLHLSVGRIVTGHGGAT